MVLENRDFFGEIRNHIAREDNNALNRGVKWSLPKPFLYLTFPLLRVLLLQFPRILFRKRGWVKIKFVTDFICDPNVPDKSFFRFDRQKKGIDGIETILMTNSSAKTFSINYFGYHFK